MIAAVQALASQTQHGADHVNRWQRALAALGALDPAGVSGGALTLAEARQNANTYSSPVWDQVVTELEAKEAFEAAQQTPPVPQPTPTPEVNITSAGGGTEGSNVTFTVSANPAPAANLAVSATVATSGDYGVTAGPRTVTIAGGTTSKTLTLPTTDDSTDEADGSVTLTLNGGSGYTVGQVSSETVQVQDDDDAPEQPQQQPATYTVDPQVIAAVQALASQTHHGTAHVNRWQRALAALGALDPAGVSGGALTLDEARQMAITYSSPVWDQVVAELEAKAAFEAAQQTQQTPPPTLEVNITSAAGGTEGSNVTFTVSANPAPTANLAVSVTVATSGDYGVTAGSRTVTIAGGTTSKTLTLPTTDDSTDEADGSVTLTLNGGSGYTMGQVSSETAQVQDDDDPQQPVVTPVVSVTGGSGVTEGGNASFTVTANPAPASALSVSVTVGASGDYGATTGSRTVTIPTGGSVTFTVATTDDSADEADGSVTATLVDGADYDLGTSSATVSVTDDDVPVVSITGGNGVTEGVDASFTITASPVPAADLTVSVTVSASGDYGATTGSRTVTVPTTGSAPLTVGTTDDSADEADGSVTATVNAGSGYTVSSSQGAATVSVSDDDDAPPVVTPVVSISGGSSVTEGVDASFTVTANPAPASALPVSVTVSASGDYGATTGSRTVTVPTTGSAPLTVGTTDDGNDEADGSVTATLVDGADYDLGTNKTATVSVADDDDAPPVETAITISIEDASASESASDLVFRVTLSEASNEDVTVQWATSHSQSPDRARGGQGYDYDFWHARGEIVIRAGKTSGTGAVWLNQDSKDEPDEVFTVTLSSPKGATLEREEGTMTIIDDD